MKPSEDELKHFRMIMDANLRAALDVAPELAAVLARLDCSPTVAVIALIICGCGTTEVVPKMPAFLGWAEMICRVLDDEPSWARAKKEAKAVVP